MGKLITFVFLMSFISVSVSAGSIYGYYSDVEARYGEPSGMEMLLLNDGRSGKCNQSVMIQHFEGVPQYPEIVDCCGCSSSNIRFVSPQFGTFVGKIESNTLVGEFLEWRRTVSLPKRNSFWQK